MRKLYSQWLQIHSFTLSGDNVMLLIGEGEENMKKIIEENKEWL